MTRSTIVVIALAVGASSSVVIGQSRPAFVPQGPVLRASVDQVVVDVVVTDASGAPVTGLTAADFEILERGKPETIASFSEVSLPLSLRPEGAPLPVPSDVRSNVGTAERRFYVLALDNENVQLRFTADVRKAAQAFVRRIVQPGDVVAVVTSTGLNVGMREFTEDMSLVEAAIDRFAGNTPPASLTNRSVPLMSGPGSERNVDRMGGAEGSDAAADELARGGIRPPHAGQPDPESRRRVGAEGRDLHQRRHPHRSWELGHRSARSRAARGDRRRRACQRDDLHVRSRRARSSQ